MVLFESCCLQTQRVGSSKILGKARKPDSIIGPGYCQHIYIVWPCSNKGIPNMTTQSTLPKPGVYRIIEYGVHGQPQVLSVDKDRNVTISGAGTLPTFEQEVCLAFWQSLWSFTYQSRPFSNSGGLKSGTARLPFSTVPIFGPRILFLTEAYLRQERRLCLGKITTFPPVHGILHMHPTYQDHSSLTCQSNTALVFPSIF